MGGGTAPVEVVALVGVGADNVLGAEEGAAAEQGADLLAHDVQLVLLKGRVEVSRCRRLVGGTAMRRLVGEDGDGAGIRTIAFENSNHRIRQSDPARCQLSMTSVALAHPCTSSFQFPWGGTITRTRLTGQSLGRTRVGGGSSQNGCWLD